MQVVVSTGKNSRVIGSAFAEGIGVRTMSPHAYCSQRRPQDVVIYGLLRGLQDAKKVAQRKRLNWVYIDNGYLTPGHFHGNYSVTINAYQHTGAGLYERGRRRFENLNLKWKYLTMWQKTGEYILILPPTEIFAFLMGFEAQNWIEDTEEKLRLATDRPVRVRRKPGSRVGKHVVPKGTSLEEDLKGAYAVVTYNSKAAIQALIQGVPVFVSSPNCCSALGLKDLKLIETPYYPDNRMSWLYALAANQFSIAEMKSGYCYRVLEEDRKEGFTEVPNPQAQVKTLFT